MGYLNDHGAYSGTDPSRALVETKEGAMMQGDVTHARLYAVRCTVRVAPTYSSAQEHRRNIDLTDRVVATVLASYCMQP